MPSAPLEPPGSTQTLRLTEQCRHNAAALLGDGLAVGDHQGGALSQRRLYSRTLALIKADLEQATSLSALPDQAAAACNLSGRHVLMRCGPAYSLDGLLTRAGTSQNRVVLDALPLAVGPTDLCGAPGEAQAHMGVCLQPESSVLTVRLAQQLSGGTSPAIQAEKAYAAPVPLDQP